MDLHVLQSTMLHVHTVIQIKSLLVLGPPQTREIYVVVDNYMYLVVDHKKLSITKKPVCEASFSYRQLASHTGFL